MLRNGYYSSRPVRYYEYEGENLIVDGHHRTQAAQNLGIDVSARPVGESYFNNRWGKTSADFIQKADDFINGK